MRTRLALIKRTLAIRVLRARFERIEFIDRVPEACEDHSAWASRGRWRGGPEGGAGYRNLARGETDAPFPCLPPSPCRWDQARASLGLSNASLWAAGNYLGRHEFDDSHLVEIAASLGHA